MSVRVVYSVGVRFPGGGIGNTAAHAARGLARHGLLHCLLCGSFRPGEFPPVARRALGLPSRALRKLAACDRSGWVDHAYNLLYDAWAARRLPPGDVFWGWNNYCLKSLARAKTLGMTSIVERASSHPLAGARLLQAEYARWGLRFRQPAPMLRRALAELRAADAVAIPSGFVRASFLAEADDARLIETPFGVDTARFRPAPPPGDAPPAAARRPFRVLFVGQAGIRKGLPDLLEAWARLGWRDAELHLVGRISPDLRAILPRYARLPGLRCTSHIPDLADTYRAADVFAFPSIEEGSALVTYEALASGLPVVTTYNAGSLVRDGVEGFIVPIRAADELAARLDDLRARPALRREMSAAARRRAEEFTWQRYGDALAAHVQEWAA